MVEVDKVSVRVVRHSDGVPYHEYAPPSDSPEHGGSPNGRYIEVSTDERYRVEVKLLPGFKFLGYPRVRARITLDNNTYTRTLSLVTSRRIQSVRIPRTVTTAKLCFR
jgi:hypothetical protein